MNIYIVCVFLLQFFFFFFFCLFFIFRSYCLYLKEFKIICDTGEDIIRRITNPRLRSEAFPGSYSSVMNSVRYGQPKPRKDPCCRVSVRHLRQCYWLKSHVWIASMANLHPLDENENPNPDTANQPRHWTRQFF